MKINQAGYLLIEALVYAGLLIFAALLAASVLVHMTALDKGLEKQVTHTCQAYNALAIFRRDLAYTPMTRTRYSILTPAEVKYTLADATITWQFDEHSARLQRICTHTRGKKLVTDHAVVLESVSDCVFSPLFVQDRVLAFTLKLSHNGKNFYTTVYTRSLA